MRCHKISGNVGYKGKHGGFLLEHAVMHHLTQGIQVTFTRPEWKVCACLLIKI